MSCVLTLAMDETAQQHFESLRQQWFPKELNRVPAHITLFHKLPESEDTIEALHSVSKLTQPFSMRVAEVRLIGKGVAYFVESRQLMSIHGELSTLFQDSLIKQDQQKFRPHVVVQNKVTPDEARKTLQTLETNFAPWNCTAVGLDFWRYIEGDWLPLMRFAFQRPVD
ncbi:MAG TPA: 2'-5' RNA ligase family protein [Drouetiella sp.]|jgi:2'-5' RNA ligase